MEGEYERFEITDRDLEELDPENRKRRKLTKNQRLYGIWADSDDEDVDDYRAGFGGDNKRLTKKSATQGVSFVKQEDAPLSPEKRASKLPNKQTAPRSAVETPSSQPNNNSSNDNKRKNNQPKTRQFAGVRAGGHAPDRNFGQWEKHTNSIGSKLMEKMGYQAGTGLGKAKQGMVAPIEVRVRKGRGAIGAYGSEFDKRTIEKDAALQRFHRLHADDENDDDADEESDTNLRGARLRGRDGWKKSADRVPATRYSTLEELSLSNGESRNSSILSAAWLVNSDNHQGVRIVDMTGKQEKVYTGYHSLAHVAKKSAETSRYSDVHYKFDVPALRHNLSTLVEMSETQVLTQLRQLEANRQLELDLRRETEQIDAKVAVEEKQKEALERIMHVLVQVEEDREFVAVDDILRAFKRLKSETVSAAAAGVVNAEGRLLAEIHLLACSAVAPFVTQDVAGWQPIQDPEGLENRVRVTFKEICDLVNDDRRLVADGILEHNPHDPYFALVWQVWIPHVAAALQSDWKPRQNNDAVLLLVEQWKPLLSTTLYDYLLQNIILARLEREVEAWEPTEDTIPLHSWLHPWLPYFASQLESILSTVRTKLAHALQRWHPSDDSALRVVEPWSRVFSQATLDGFLAKSIVPKLAKAMANEFHVVVPRSDTIAASKSKSDPWDWLMIWCVAGDDERTSFLPVRFTVAILEQHFFPKWLTALSRWLEHFSTLQNSDDEDAAGVELDAIRQWYIDWKERFPASLRAQPSVEENFNTAVGIMHKALSGEPPPFYVAPPQSANKPPLLPTPTTTAATKASSFSSQVDVTAQLTFRELIEARAANAGLMFVPLPGKRQHGKPIFQLGSRVQVYFDRNVIFVNKVNVANGTAGNKRVNAPEWTPAGVEELFEIAA